MKIPGYHIDLEKALEIIKKNKYKLAALQVPEGLKTHISKFIEYIESKTDAQVVIYEDPCFGACDTVTPKLIDIGVDFAIQIGHSKIPNLKESQIPMIYVNAESDIDISKIIQKAIPHIKGKKVGIVTTTQHIKNLGEIKLILEKNGFEPIIGKADERIEFDGQILGCDFSSATSIKDDIDMFLYVGSGNFHPLGLMLSTKKPVIIANPYDNSIRFNELKDLKDTVLRQRYGAIARSKDAKVFGILVGTKIGQQRIDLANKIKEMLDSKNKKSYMIASNFFNPANLETFRDIDCFVSTACPRIAIDDYMRYKTPIITPVELEILLGVKKWDDYCFDEIS